MHRTLVTFLGRGQSKPDLGYPTATYRFPDGRKMTTAFFGLALAEYLEPDTVVVLGTRGSQWGVLVEHLAWKSEEEINARVELIGAEDKEAVTQEMLNAVEFLMTRGAGRTVVPRLIPFGKDAGEQYYILAVIADAVANNDVSISFDVTHGFRHLGMVGFLSSFMLEQVRRLKVQDLWYGALDMTADGITPVLELDGLVRVQRWVDALARFDATGDYGLFVPLLVKDGVDPDKAKCLETAAFHERACNLSDAKRSLDTFSTVLADPLQGASDLFKQKLEERLSWTKGESLIDHQRMLAYQYLGRGDFIRAAIFGWECLVTLKCEEYGYDHNDFNKESPNGRVAAIKKARRYWRTDYKGLSWDLEKIRNSLAHGSPSEEVRIRGLIKVREKLFNALKKAFDKLLK